EQIDLRLAGQRRQRLALPRYRDHRLGAVEQIDDLDRIELGDSEKVPMTEGEEGPVSRAIEVLRLSSCHCLFHSRLGVRTPWGMVAASLRRDYQPLIPAAADPAPLAGYSSPRAYRPLRPAARGTGRPRSSSVSPPWSTAARPRKRWAGRSSV